MKRFLFAAQLLLALTLAGCGNSPGVDRSAPYAGRVRVLLSARLGKHFVEVTTPTKNWRVISPATDKEASIVFIRAVGPPPGAKVTPGVERYGFQSSIDADQPVEVFLSVSGGGEDTGYRLAATTKY